MKTKTWILLIALVLLLCLGLSIVFLLPKGASTHAQIISDGRLMKVVELAVDQEFTVTAPHGGTNTVTVRDGAIAVTAANCPDHYCMHRGFCDGGSSIVCLPNRLIIEFVGEQEVDFVVE